MMLEYYSEDASPNVRLWPVWSMPLTARREVWSLNSTMKLEMFTGDLVPIGYKEVLREQEVQVSNDAKDVPSQIVDLSIRGV